MKKLYFILLFLCSVGLYSQYSIYTIADVGSISISDEMELQSGDYREIMSMGYNQFSQKIGYEVDFNDRIVFQHKEVNSFENLKENYIRIIIETEYGNFNPLTSIKPTLSVEELRELTAYIKSGIEESFRGTPLKLLQFYGVSFEKINQQVALKVSYLRRYGDNPPAKVSIYQFENNDRMHTLTISCRVTDEAQWRDKLEKSLSSFKINRK